LGGPSALVILATTTGTLLPAEAHVPDTVATLKASPAELFPLFNSRAGQRRVLACQSRIACHAATGSWTSPRQ